MLKKYTCIICPNGCEIEAEVLDGEIKSVSGFTCKRGEEYVRQEILAPAYYCKLCGSKKW